MYESSVSQNRINHITLSPRSKTYSNQLVADLGSTDIDCMVCYTQKHFIMGRGDVTSRTLLHHKNVLLFYQMLL